MKSPENHFDHMMSLRAENAILATVAPPRQVSLDP